MLAEILFWFVIWTGVGLMVMLSFNSLLMKPQQFFVTGDLDLFGRALLYTVDAIVVVVWPLFLLLFIAVYVVLAVVKKFFPNRYAWAIPFFTPKEKKPGKREMQDA